MSDLNLVKDWFRHSRNDLISATHLFADLYPKQIEISCYLCQQTAETALKGFLVYKDVEPPKIHNLRVLCQLCLEIDVAFEAIVYLCIELTKYGSITRYPNELETDEYATKIALEKARNVYEFCLAKIPEAARPTTE